MQQQAVHASERQRAGNRAEAHKHTSFSHTALGAVHSVSWEPAGICQNTVLICDFKQSTLQNGTTLHMRKTPHATDLHRFFQSDIQARKAVPGLVLPAGLCMACSETELVGG